MSGGKDHQGTQRGNLENLGNLEILGEREKRVEGREEREGSRKQTEQMGIKRIENKYRSRY